MFVLLLYDTTTTIIVIIKYNGWLEGNAFGVVFYARLILTLKHTTVTLVLQQGRIPRENNSLPFTLSSSYILLSAGESTLNLEAGIKTIFCMTLEMQENLTQECRVNECLHDKIRNEASSISVAMENKLPEGTLALVTVSFPSTSALSLSRIPSVHVCKSLKVANRC
jgi:hypothetical protein